jgi:hypothetical protein
MFSVLVLAFRSPEETWKKYDKILVQLHAQVIGLRTSHLIIIFKPMSEGYAGMLIMMV